MELRFITSNDGKLREARAILADYGVRVRGVRRTLPEPQADSLEVVVHAKLRALAPRGGFQLVEDSGLFIAALGGFPGVYSAYAYRTLGLPALISLLRGRPRSATFRTVAGLRLGRATRLFVGESAGSIARAPRGSGGFGFDPIFLPRGSRHTFAELSPEEKDRRSHRGRALRAVGAYLRDRERDR